MRPRIFATAALSAAFSAALAAAADPLPLPGTPVPALPAIPAIEVPNAKPIAPGFLPPTRPVQEKIDPPKPLPVVPAPRSPGDAPPKGSDAPPKFATESHAAMPDHAMPPEKKIHDDHLGPWNAVWVRGGYNYLWITQAPMSVPLLSSNNGTTILGNTRTEYGGFSGLTFDGGVWLNERHTLGIGASGFIAEQRSTVAGFSSDAAGNPGFTRPFYNPQVGGTNGVDAFIVSAPGQYSGSIAYEQGATVNGFEIFGLYNMRNDEKWTVNFSAGFRYFDLEEYATVYQVTQSLQGDTIPFFQQQPGVNAVMITDRVRTRNQFYGGQLGGDAEYRLGMVFLDLGLKAALGPVHQVTEVEGRTDGPNGASGPGGFLAVGYAPNGNQVRISTDRFAVLADVNGLIGIQVSQHLRLGIGYQFMYLTDVARPSNQYVTSVDPRLVPTSTSFGARTPSDTSLGGLGTPPNTPYDRSDFFLHGLRFLAELQY